MKTGNIFIYNNNLLCANETKKFLEIVERPQPSLKDSIQNNGGKNKCLAGTIEVSHKVISHDTCTIQWKDFISKDKQRFSAYIVQYVKIKSTKLLDEQKLFERDSCSSYGWQHALVKRDQWRRIPIGKLEFNLTGLTQFTTYAYTVQTYQFETNATSIQMNSPNVSEYEGAISPVKNFRTLLKAPSRVKRLELVETTSDSISIRWNIVENEEAAIEFFLIDIVEKPFNVTKIDRRNYCEDPIEKHETQSLEAFRFEEMYVERSPSERNACCEDCCEIKQKLQDSAKLQALANSDFIESLVKIANEVPRKKKQLRKQINLIDRVDLRPDMRSYTRHQLDPFTLYSFYVYACSSDSKCSDFEFVSVMTNIIANESYDRVELKPSSYELESQSFHIHFEEPKLTNGLILNYVTELREIVKNSSVFLLTECVTRQKHETNGFEYSIYNLGAGTYIFRVMAVSLGRKGTFTDFHQFVIIKPEKTVSKGWFILIPMLLLLILVAAVVSYYYKHKIMLLLRNQSDTLELIKEMEPTDNFYEISLHHKSFDRLSDITEYEE